VAAGSFEPAAIVFVRVFFAHRCARSARGRIFLSTYGAVVEIAASIKPAPLLNSRAMPTVAGMLSHHLTDPPVGNRENAAPNPALHPNVRNVRFRGRGFGNQEHIPRPAFTRLFAM
jgi:hypothetical protein